MTTGGAKHTAVKPGAGRGMRIAVIAARFNEPITSALLQGAREGLAGTGVDLATVTEAWVPGAFELPLAALRLAQSGEFDAVVCLGAVIKGDTDHDTYVASQCAAGLQRAQLDTGVPVVFGVLTTETLQQAEDRAGGKHGNKGTDAAETAVEMVDLLRHLQTNLLTEGS